MDEIFAKLSAQLEEEAARKDDIRALVRKQIDPVVREAQSLIQSVHSPHGLAQVHRIHNKLR